MFYSFVTMNIPFVLLYIFLGGVFLFSAYSLWKKDKNYYMRIIPTIYLAVQRQGIFVGNE